MRGYLQRLQKFFPKRFMKGDGKDAKEELKDVN